MKTNSHGSAHHLPNHVELRANFVHWNGTIKTSYTKVSAEKTVHFLAEFLFVNFNIAHQVGFLFQA